MTEHSLMDIMWAVVSALSISAALPMLMLAVDARDIRVVLSGMCLMFVGLMVGWSLLT